MIEVKITTFIKPEKYIKLIEKYNNTLKTEKQVTMYFDPSHNFSMTKTKTYTKLCMKNKEYNEINENEDEKIVKIDNKYREDLETMLNILGYKPILKWYRTTSISRLDIGIDLCLDYIVGLGYVLDVKKQIEDQSKTDLTKIELGNFIESLDIDLTPKKEIDKKYEDYILNWNIYTEKVDESKYI